MKNIGIYVNRERDTDLEATRHTADALYARNLTVFLDKSLEGLVHTGSKFVSHEEMLQKSELIIALGGDGTILKIVQDAAKHDVPVLGINIGHLGFLAQAERDDQDIFDKIAQGDFTINYPMMLEAKINGNCDQTRGVPALNDIILRGSEGKMVSLEVWIDGTMANQYQADGIIIATSTGSTAYSLSCGGPIVHNSLDCMILTPICPHTMKARCVIIPPDSKVTLKFSAANQGMADLKADGRAVKTLTQGDTVEVTRSALCAPLVALDDHNYFDVVRRKLSD